MNTSQLTYFTRVGNAAFAAVTALAILSPSAQAAQSSSGSGEIAIYSEATGTDTIAPNGSTAAGFLTHDFDTDDREDTGSFTRAGTDITLNRAGHYLAIYNSRFNGAPEAGTEERVELQSYLTLGGNALSSGWSQGYIRRDQLHLDAITSGMAVFEATANDVLQLRTFRTDTTTVGTVTRPANGTGIQLIKLDEVNMSYARLSLAANQTGPVNDTWVKVAYDTDDELDAGFTHGTAGDLTLTDAGKYLVIANTYSQGSTNRTSLIQRLTLDGAEVAGSKTTVYLRNAQSANEGAAALGMIIEATAGQVLNVEGSLDTTQVSNYTAGRCALTVIKLPSLAGGTAPADPEYVRLRHEVDQDVNTASDTPLIFALQDEVDSAFSHPASGSTVTVNTFGDYLFLSTVYDNDDQVPRSAYNQGWRLNGSGRSILGQSARYARSTGGADQFGNTSGFIGSALVATNTVEMVSMRMGNGNVNNANRISLQGVRLASLFDFNPAFEVIIDPLAVTVSEAGATATYDMSLGLPPSSGSVDITVTSDADTEVSLDGTNFFASVTPSYTAGGVPQTITVRAFDDSIPEIEEVATISHAITATGDPINYPTTLPILDVQATVPINDITPVDAIDDASMVNAAEDVVSTEATLAPQSDLLANDTDGLNNFVTSADSASTEGAVVNVASDGTFTYDPANVATVQAIPAGGTLNDTFSYTAEDADGNTDSATVTLTVAGANDPVEATDNYLNDGPLEDASSFVSTVDLTGNDGVYRRGPVLTFPPNSDLRLLPGKTVTQSPSSGPPPPGNGFAERAFDGIPGTFTHTASNTNTVDHVWQVDLGQDALLENVTVFGRLTNTNRFRDITVTVLDSSGGIVFDSGLLNPTTVPLTIVPSLFVDFAGPITGRTLVVTRTPDPGDTNASEGSILSLSEVTLIGSVPGTFQNNSLALDYDAAQSAGTGRWENRGGESGTAGDWILTDVTLDPAPVTSRTGITAAYEWDNIADRALLAGGSIHGILGDADVEKATWEFWVKPDNLTQVMTIFETGGGAGFGAIINNGVFEAATELDGGSQNGSYVSYNLNTDTMSVLGGVAATAEFHQYVVIINPGQGLSLWVNGVKVDESASGAGAHWDGGDASGLGRFGANNHGGFTNGAAGGTYDAPFLGQMAAVRLYSGALTAPQIYQNFNAVDTGTDIDGDTIAATGVLDGTGTFVANGSPATLASGALVTMSNATGGFDYDPNGAFVLLPGQVVTDTFTYRVTDGNGSTADAEVTLNVTGVASIIDDAVLAWEEQVVTYTPNELVKNDELIVTPGAYLDLAPSSISGTTWVNAGSAGASRNANISSVLAAPVLESGFEALGCAAVSATTATLDPISAADATIEVWFKPDAGQAGNRTIFETGGNGIGFSLVFNPTTNEVIATIDGNNDVTQKVQAIASGVVTNEFNQVIVVFDINGGAEVAPPSGVFVDIMDVYLNNDPVAGFDPTLDATASQADGTVNDWSGTDGIGINAVSGTSAVNENFPGMEGTVAIVRAYPSILSASQMEDNFDASIQPITAVSSPTTTQGAPVTLNLDGTVSVNYTGLSLGAGGFAADEFTYTTALGSATVSVAIDNNSIIEDWRASFFGTAENAGAGEDTNDANANNFDNLTDFALGLDPVTVGAVPDLEVSNGTITQLGQPRIWEDPTDGKFYFQYTRRVDYVAAGLTIVEEFSRALVDWEIDASAVATPIATGTGAGGVAIEAMQVELPSTLPIGGGKARYGRLSISIAP